MNQTLKKRSATVTIPRYARANEFLIVKVSPYKGEISDLSLYLYEFWKARVRQGVETSPSRSWGVRMINIIGDADIKDGGE